jgi:hypothetical protein
MAESETADIDSQEGANIDRINQQCWLVDNYKSYAFPGHNYKNLTCMMGNPTEVLQRLSAKPGQEAFLSMTNDKYAQLVPVIRLFRVPMDPVTKKQSAGAKKEEIKFSTQFNERHVMTGTPGDITRGYRGDQVGLKELNYEFQEGGGDITLGRRQVVTLKFTADSLQAVARSGLLSLLTHPKSTEYQFDKSGKKVSSSAKPNSNFYAVQLVYGWALPPGRTSHGGLNRFEMQAVKKSVSTLTLNLRTHDFSFNDDGSLEISAEYEGYADAKMGETSANILRSSSASSKRVAEEQGKVFAQEAKVKQIKESEEKSAAKKEKDEKDGKAKEPTEAQEKQVETDQRIAKEEKEKLKKVKQDEVIAIQGDRQEKYSRILNDLRGTNKIWVVEVPADQMGRSEGGMMSSGGATKVSRGAKPTADQWEKLSDDEKTEYDEKRAKAPPRGTAPAATKAAPASTANATNGATQAIKEHAGKKVVEAAKSDDTSSSEKKKDTTQALADYNKTNVSEASGWGDGGTVKVNFVYWGDLLSAAVRYAYTDAGVPLPLRYLVGTINFTDPRTGKTDTINLADVPISLNLFTTWWLEKIVAPQRDNYTIRSFVTDSINELIVAALGDSCYAGAQNFGTLGSGASKNLSPPRVHFTTISAPLGQGQKDRLGSKGRLGMGADEIIEYANSRSDNKLDWTAPENQVEYVYVFCNAWSTKKKHRGNEREDKEKGIYHIHIGTDRGPIKRVKFEQDEDMSEAMRTDQMLEGQSIDQLVQHYNAKVEMLGNTIWDASNLVFISPTSLGVDPGFAARMGFGGYYTVTELSGKLDSAGWTTEMSCIHQFKTHAEKAGTRMGDNAPAPAAGSKPKNPEEKQK